MTEETLGKRIVFHRKRLGLTQDALAERLGVTAQAVSKWENDQSCPDITMVPRLADLFGITTDVLLGVEKKQVHQAEIVEEEEQKAEGLHIQKGDWELKWDSGRKGTLGMAVWVLLAGALLLAGNILQKQYGLWDVLWPAAIFVFGIFGLWPRFSFFRLGCELIGAYFLLVNTEFIPFRMDRGWILALFLLLFGMSLLVDALRKKETRGFRIINGGKNTTKSVYETEGERFRTVLGFGETHHNVALPRLSGGSAEVSFGELTLDLSECQQIMDGCTLDVKCAFGELGLRIPKGCVVETNVSTSFGSLEVEGTPAPKATTVIRLNGSVSFGEITLEYL